MDYSDVWSAADIARNGSISILDRISLDYKSKTYRDKLGEPRNKGLGSKKMRQKEALRISQWRASISSSNV